MGVGVAVAVAVRTGIETASGGLTVAGLASTAFLDVTPQTDSIFFFFRSNSNDVQRELGTALRKKVTPVSDVHMYL